MDKQQLFIFNFPSQKDWDLTPKSIRDFVLLQKQRIEELEKQLAQSKTEQEILQEKANTNSQNSGVPTSTEIIKPEPKKSQSNKKKNKRVGQKGQSVQQCDGEKQVLGAKVKQGVYL